MDDLIKRDDALRIVEEYDVLHDHIKALPTIDPAAIRAAALEAKLAKAVEALREILTKPRSIEQTYVELWADTIKEVRAVLAELEGGSEYHEKQSG